MSVVMLARLRPDDVVKSYNLHANCYHQTVDLDQFLEVVKSMGQLVTVVMLPPR